MKNNSLGVSSFISFTNLPQKLNITPGQYSDILNMSQPYDEIIQAAQLKEFFNNNSISFGKKIGAFNFNNKIGLSFKLQKLSNDLGLVQNDFQFPANGNFENEININLLKIYDEASLTFNTGKFSARLGLNVNFNSLSNNGQNTRQTADELFVNPNLGLSYVINSFWDTYIRVTNNENISFQANPSYVLQNYRSLTNSDVPLYRKKGSTFNYGLNYKNIVNAVFASLSTSYTRNSSNILLESQYNQSLVTQTAIVQESPSANLSITANINKYYLAFKTRIDFSLNYGVNTLKQLQQSVLTDFESKTIGFGTKINTKVSKAFSFTHTLDLTRYKSAATQLDLEINYDPISFFKQSLALNVFFPRNYTAKLIFEHYYNNANHLSPVNYYFADATIQKSIVKHKLDFSLMLSNVFNVKSYTSSSYINNYLINSNYTLRSRMLMFKVGFQF